MRVLLINPPWPGGGIGTRSQNRIIKKRGDKFLQYPLMMAGAAAVLKQEGHEVKFIDAVIDDLDYTATDQKVMEFMPEVILMETVTPSFPYDSKYMAHLKKLTWAKIFLGGTHVTAMPVQSMEECDAIDVVIKGDFDARMKEIMENIYDLSDVKGITFRNKKEEIIDTGKPAYPDNLDNLPFPDREIVPLENYGEAWYNKRPFTNMLTSRGCPYSCTFCISPWLMEGIKWRRRSIPNVIAEIKELVEKYGVKEINLDDPTFTIDKQRVMDFSQGLIDNNLKILWTCNGRVDNIVRHGMDMLHLMRKSGCKMIRFGIESGSPEVLQAISKKLTLDQMREGVKMAQKAGILALCGFMFGFPSDSKESIQATYDIAMELKSDLMQASIAMPYPGTPLYKEAVDTGAMVAKDWTEFDMTHGIIVNMKDMTPDQLTGILKKLYKDFYFRPRFFLQTLGNIRRFSDISRIYRNFFAVLRATSFYDKVRI